MLTPVEVEVLLHCFYRPEPPPSATPAYRAAVGKLLGMSVIVSREGAYECTPLGDAWVKAICKTPAPKQVFVDASGARL